MAPHGVYRCRDDEWIAIAVSSDAGWKALTRAMAQPGLAEHAAFKTLVDRKANENELNRLIAQWTATQDARELAADLQRRGVAAAKSATSIDLVSDPHLWERGFFPTIADRGEQARPIAGPSWKTTRDAVIARGAPRLGEHNAYVLGEILGLSVEEQQRLADAKVAY
jgi:crotonobetainyl-CoA:carnitine CoA-transferase CaiB-like acyl-CoA transferase